MPFGARLSRSAPAATPPPPQDELLQQREREATALSEHNAALERHVNTLMLQVAALTEAAAGRRSARGSPAEEGGGARRRLSPQRYLEYPEGGLEEEDDVSSLGAYGLSATLTCPATTSQQIPRRSDTTQTIDCGNFSEDLSSSEAGRSTLRLKCKSLMQTP